MSRLKTLLLMLLTLAPGCLAQDGAQAFIAGKVVDADGGVPFAVVSARSIAGGAAAERAETVADAEGKFRLSGLRSVLYRVTAFSPGFVAAEPGGDEDVYFRAGESCTLRLVKGGVIAGRIARAQLPVAVLPVAAVRVADLEGKAASPFRTPPLFQTDDRGEYRIHGLPPGRYVVVANPSRIEGGPRGSFEGDAPVYYPASASRAGARLVTVMPGQVLSGMDIELGSRRKGYWVEGRVAVSGEKQRGASLLVELLEAQTGEIFGTTLTEAGRGGFYFGGVADGEYELTASVAGSAGAGSKPTRISVRGADIRGVQLPLSTAASVAGSVVAAPTAAPDCKPRGPDKRGPHAREMDAREMDVRRLALGLAGERARPKIASPSADGSFEIEGLEAGDYRAVWGLPDEHWYVKSIALDGGQRAALLKQPLRLGPGQRLTGVTVSVAGGGATLTGKVAGLVGSEKKEIILVPEAEAAEQPWSYAWAEVDAAGNFKLRQIAPGKYRAVVRTKRGPDFWHEQGRQALRKIAGQPVEVRACEDETITLREAR
jgi:hypothetical protein